MTAAPSSEQALLSQIIATELLEERPSKLPDFRKEAQALGDLAHIFATRPADLGKALVDAAIRLTGAKAAGISLEIDGATPRSFRWTATAGTYTRYQDGTMPWDFSPCGEVVRAGKPLLMREPIRLYNYIESLHEPAHEVLLVPFHRAGKPIGTVWIVSHTDALRFDKEDLRLVQSLTKFAAAAVQNIGMLQQLEAENTAQLAVDARKDEFLAILAHEMRSPLSAISLNTQVLKRVGDDAARRKVATAIIERQTGQLTRLVSDITDMVAIRNGKLALNRQPVAIQEVIAGALESCGDSLTEKNHLLEVELPEDSAYIDADLLRMTQVLTNLLNNAIKYTPPGGKIKISTQLTGTSVALCVSDSGQGLTAAAMEDVFDMFMQVPNEHRQASTGLGIGLALVKQLVALHDGVLTVTSEGLGKGAAFTVQLGRA